MINTWGDILGASFQNLWNGVIMFLPLLLASIVILLIGWAVGVFVGKGVAHFIKMIKLDEALRQAGFEDVVKRSGLNLNTGNFLGSLVKYFIIVVFLMVSFDVLHLTQVTEFLRQVVVGYIPQLIVGVLFLLVGVVVGDVVAKIVTASARTAGLSQANFLGTVAKWAIWIFAILISLQQMGIAAVFIQKLLDGFIIAVSLGLGLSFGLGGQQAAARTIDKVQNSLASHNH